MSLSVDLSHRLGAFELDARFASDGRLIALFGPSGSGKTTLVNLIGGLLRPRWGRVVAAGRTLLDTEARIFLPPHRRRIGYVFQDARLFPHLTVRQNLRYGRFFTPAGERYAKMEDVVDLLGIGHLLERRPNLLSGGEKQRVAIGRALIASPRLILMDEPLASLDEARKSEILPYIERLRDETAIPIVYVSHSVAEVARLASDVVVLAQGRVTAAGPAGDILRRLDILPEDARGEGGAILHLEVVAHDAASGLTRLRSVAGDWHLPRIDALEGGTVRVLVRARDVMIATRKPGGLSALNILEGRIRAMELGEGPEARIVIDCSGQEIVARITRHSVAALGLAEDKRVFAVVKSVSLKDAAAAPAGP